MCTVGGSKRLLRLTVIVVAWSKAVICVELIVSCRHSIGLRVISYWERSCICSHLIK